MKIDIDGCGYCLILVLAIIAAAILLALACHGDFACGLFQEPYTGGWLLCLAGKCWTLLP